MRGDAVLTDDFKKRPKLDLLCSLSGSVASPVTFRRNFNSIPRALPKPSSSVVRHMVKHEMLDENSEEQSEIMGKENQLWSPCSFLPELRKF